MDEFQRHGTTFPLNIETRHKRSQFFTLMDTGAMHSCINYNTFRKLNIQLTQREVPKVMGADGGDLGSMGTVELTLSIGVNKVDQEFIVCRELRRNIILGVDFAKCNCSGIQWTTNRTRVLSLNGVKAVEVEEDELGIPVTASYHVRVPPRHNAVFEVNIHAETQGMQVITGNKHLLEKYPNMYQHKIAMLAEENSEKFLLMAITNLDHVKTLHLAKGEVVGFARPESSEVTYIVSIPKGFSVFFWIILSHEVSRHFPTHTNIRELREPFVYSLYANRQLNPFKLHRGLNPCPSS